MGLRTQFVFFTSGGVPETGLTPTFSTWRTAAGAVPSVSAPAITEISAADAPGGYTYEVPDGLTADVFGVIDGGATLPAAERYVARHIKPADYSLGTGGWTRTLYTTWDGDLPTAATVYVYDTQAAFGADTDEDGTGASSTQTLTWTYDSMGRVTSVTQEA